MRKQIKFTRIATFILALLMALCTVSLAEDSSYDLKRGDKGDDVKSLQEQLQYLGYYTKAINESFDADTEAAVIAFNEAHGLSGGVATEDMQWLVYSYAALPACTSNEGLLISLESLADGVYMGTLSGDSYANSKGTMLTEIRPSEITATIQNGQITLYCEATASASGNVGGKETPHSPDYTKIISGMLPLRQIGNTLVLASGYVSLLGEDLTIYYSGDKFKRWEVSPCEEGSVYTCVVYIRMIDGVPAAEVDIYGDISYQYCTIPLSLRTESSK